MADRDRSGVPLTLVTGGCGFIGSHIVSSLVEAGERVRVLDNFATGKRENLDGIDGEVELIEADLREPSPVRDAVDGADFVLHLGALGSVARSVDDPIATNDTNINGTLNVLNGAREAGVRRVVFASSSSVYGDTEVLPKVESMPPRPRSPYAASKVAGEAYCIAFASSYGLETISLRYFNVFGPRQDPESRYAAVIPRFISTMLAGAQPTIFGDGHQTRDFTYVSNVAQATIAARTAPGASGRVFNIGCGAPHSVLDLVKRINESIGRDIGPLHGPPRPGDVRHSHADITAASEWGYDPDVSFSEGLDLTIAHFRNLDRTPARL